jgi:hypothetical protein
VGTAIVRSATHARGSIRPDWRRLYAPSDTSIARLIAPYVLPAFREALAAQIGLDRCLAKLEKVVLENAKVNADGHNIDHFNDFSEEVAETVDSWAVLPEEKRARLTGDMIMYEVEDWLVTIDDEDFEI